MHTKTHVLLNIHSDLLHFMPTGNFLLNTVAEPMVLKESEEQQPIHTLVTGSHGNQHDVAATTLTQHDDNVSSQSTITSADQDNEFISRSQLRKILKAEIRKLLVTNLC